jgi:hypothetical protein
MNPYDSHQVTSLLLLVLLLVRSGAWLVLIADVLGELLAKQMGRRLAAKGGEMSAASRHRFAATSR